MARIKSSVLEIPPITGPKRLAHLFWASVCLFGCAAAVSAGSFTSNFSNPNQAGLTLNGTGTAPDGTSWMPYMTNNTLVLTTTTNSLGGSLVLDDLDGGQPIDAFTANFSLQLGPGSNPPADGVAFAFGPDINSASNFSEEGPGGAGDITVEFDTYNNGSPDNIGIDVKVGSTEVATTTMTDAQLVDSKSHPVSIQLNANGTLNVAWNSQVIYTNLYLTGWAPTSGQFAFGARTGGAYQYAALSNLTVNTTVAGAATTAAVSSSPQTQTINESSNVTFSVGFSGTPPFTFQWSSNNVPIQDATNSFLTLTNVSAALNGTKFQATVSNSLGSAPSQAATLTVTPDLTPPTVVSAAASNDFRHILVTFSKPVTQASAQTASNYQINGLTVSSASLSTNDNQTVVLSTSALAENTPYTLTINGVKDTRASANTIAANSTFNFTSISVNVVSAGALGETNGVTFDVGVTFSAPVDTNSATAVANYKLSAGTIQDVSYFASSPGVVLRATGLTPGSTYSISISNVVDMGGNKIAAANQQFTVSNMQWGEVGADQLGLGYPAGYGVVAVGTNGFDVYSDGFSEWNNYDESTFVYQKITGDFDKKVRVEYQDLSSEWARAGLIAREVPNFGVDAPTQTGDPSGAVSNSGTPPFPGTATRYQKIHVNPVGPTLTGPGTPGNALWEGNRRLDTGGPSSTALTGPNSTPKYPNAWCRLQRVGQTFTIYRSDDGTNWVNLGSTTWPDTNDPTSTPMPATLYVGPDYSPENGNITDANSRGRFLAKFRDYGDTTNSVSTTGASISIARSSSGVTLSFSGTLQSADNVTGPWTNVSGTSPMTVPTSGKEKFFRVQ